MDETKILNQVTKLLNLYVGQPYGIKFKVKVEPSVYVDEYDLVVTFYVDNKKFYSLYPSFDENYWNFMETISDKFDEIIKYVGLEDGSHKIKFDDEGLDETQKLVKNLIKKNYPSVLPKITEVRVQRTDNFKPHLTIIVMLDKVEGEPRNRLVHKYLLENFNFDEFFINVI
jgi:hypothetical protein